MGFSYGQGGADSAFDTAAQDAAGDSVDAQIVFDLVDRAADIIDWQKIRRCFTVGLAIVIQLPQWENHGEQAPEKQGTEGES